MNFLIAGAKTMMKTTLVLTLLFSALSSQAATKNYFMQNQKFSIDVPNGWREVNDFLGTPLALFGPEQPNDEPRIVMLVAPTGLEDTKNFLKHPPKDISTYKAGREAWLEETYGSSKSYDKFKQEKWAGIENSNQLGYHYENANGSFYERSIYITCAGNKIFYIKSLVPEKLEKTANSVVQNTIKSLKCNANDVKTAKN